MPAQPHGGQPERQCSKCAAWKPLDLFVPSPVCSLGRRRYCKACRNGYERQNDRRASTRARKRALREALRRVEHIPGARSALVEMLKETG